MNIMFDVVVVNRQSGSVACAALRSLIESSELSSVPVHVILVDNGSSASDRLILDGLPPCVDRIDLPENRGFARAANLGARRGSAPWLFFLNPDTLVMPETLRGLARHVATDREQSLWGPRQYLDAELRFWVAPIRGTSLFGEAIDAFYDRGWTSERSRRFLTEHMKASRSSGPVRVRVLSGGALAMPRPLFDKLGGFDEGYFLYVEDTDLCVRARRLGHDAFWLPDVPVVHFVEGSTRLDRDLAMASLKKGIDRFKMTRHGWAQRLLARGLERVAQTMPRRRDRWRDASGWSSVEEFAASSRLSSRERVFSLARSPLFDNCIHSVWDRESETAIAGLIGGLPAGRYFARIASLERPGCWREDHVARIDVPVDGESSPSSSLVPATHPVGVP